MGLGGDIKQSCQGWSLVIRPLILQDAIVKQGIVVISGADINDEIGVMMILIKVSSNIANRIPICFFQEIGSRKCHRNDSISNISQI